jgi:hypothetical protein
MMLTIGCLRVTSTGKVMGGVFPLRVPADELVGFFLEVVQKKQGPSIPDNFPADFLVPWKPDTFFPDFPHGDLAGHVANLNLNSEDNCAATELDPTAELQQYFQQPLLPGLVHIVIQFPPEHLDIEADLPREEAERDDYDNLLDYMAGSRYVLDTPSFISKPGEFQNYQDTLADYRIMNDRPSKDVKVTPITLLYAPFGQFFDDIAERSNKDLRRFEFAVDNFALVMCKHFKDEKERQRAVLPVLNDIFASYKPYKLPPIEPGKIVGERTSGGHATGPVQTMEVVLEIKNEYGTGGSDPEIQYTSYYLQMYRYQIRSGPYKECIEKYICPVLGISIIGQTRLVMLLACSQLLTHFFSGSNIGFGALVLLDKARCVQLTPLLSARSPSGDRTHRPALVQAFLAACALRASIHEDMVHILRNRYTLPRLHQRNFPYVQKVPAWPPTDDGEREIEFRILRVAGQLDDPGLWNDARFLYLAKIQHQVVLVKFTHQYSPELHHFCAERYHAPKLLGYGTVPGGWKVVVMEFVEHDRDQRARYALKHWVKWEQDLTRLVQDFHGRGLVHGDLRVANFMIPTKQPETIKLIDFDWAGEAGKVYFPNSRLNEELADETRDDLLITKAHDIRVLNAAMGRLKPATNS